MKIAAAQISVGLGQIESNLEQHYQKIKQAGDQGVGLILFPEMSITGYCRKEAKALAFTENDKRLQTLKRLAQDYQIIIIAGAPIEVAEQLFIGSFVILADGSLSYYTKQHLHGDEAIYFDASFDYDPTFQLASERLSLAICADITHPSHPQLAKEAGTSLYLASIFYSKAGIEEGHHQLQNYAQQHELAILMANFSGELWGINSGGKSAFWDPSGKLIATLDTTTGLLVVEKHTRSWKAINPSMLDS